MDKKEIEDKKLELLTDEELKEVAGGSYFAQNHCVKKQTPGECLKLGICAWQNGTCVFVGK
jgi:hypothetical protein